MEVGGDACVETRVAAKGSPAWWLALKGKGNLHLHLHTQLERRVRAIYPMYYSPRRRAGGKSSAVAGVARARAAGALPMGRDSRAMPPRPPAGQPPHAPFPARSPAHVLSPCSLCAPCAPCLPVRLPQPLKHHAGLALAGTAGAFPSRMALRVDRWSLGRPRRRSCSLRSPAEGSHRRPAAPARGGVTGSAMGCELNMKSIVKGSVKGV